MKVLYAGGTWCDYRTLQRLVLIADEIAFMDRPSVTFGNWGTIGAKSEFRKYDTSDAPISFSVHAPPSGPADNLYRAYIESDLNNPHFITSFIDGLVNNEKFQSRFIQPKAHYGCGTGEDVLRALIQDKSLASADYSEHIEGKLPYEI